MNRIVDSLVPGADVQPRPSVELHIEELVLHGFAPVQRQQVEEGVQRELTRQLQQWDPAALPSPNRQFESLNAGSFRLSLGQADAFGCQIARSIYAATTAAIAPPSAKQGDARQ